MQPFFLNVIAILASCFGRKHGQWATDCRENDRTFKKDFFFLSA